MKHHNTLLSKVLSTVLFLLIIGVTSAFSQTMIQKPITTTVNSVIGGYYEALPSDYSTSSKKYPLLVFLHGIGEVGDGSSAQLPLVLRNGPPKLINEGKFPGSFTVNNQSFSFIVISPQMNTQDRSGNSIQSLIDYLLKKYRVDQNRIYLTGLSMGGGISWIYGGTSPWTSRLAALAPVSGNTYPYDAFVNNIANANLPVWAFHNLNDPTVPSSYTQEWIAKLNAHVPAPSPLAKGTIFNASGHDAWTQAYDPNYRENGKNVYEWMLQYQLGSSSTTTTTTNTPPTVNAGADKNITLPTSSVALSASASDPDGSISSYSWTKISGPSQFSFSSTTVPNPTVSGLAQGTYTFRITVKDNQGASTSDDINIVVYAATSTTTTTTARVVNVNIYGGSNAYNSSQWNNWKVITGTNLSSAALNYSDGSASSIKASLSQSAGMADNSSTYGGSMAPAEVLRYVSYSTISRTLTISGLSSSKKYDLDLYSSRKSSSNSTVFTVGSQKITINADNNLSTKASFTSLSPNAQGQIIVSIDRLNTFNYVDGFTIAEQGSSSAQTSTQSIGSATNISSSTDLSPMQIFPNPIQDRFVLRVNNELAGKMNVQIVDMNGSIKKQFSLSKPQTGSDQIYLSIGELAKGEYIINVQIGNWAKSQKISKL